MKIVDLLKRESVELNGKVTSKPEAIEKMVALMAAGGNLADVEAYKKGVFAREEESMNILTLKELRNTEVDMFSTVYIGNKMTKIIKHKMVTPRGYRYDRK